MQWINKLITARRSDPLAEGSDAQQYLANQPLLLIVGSLDAGSRADVLAFARGLVDSQVIAKDACFVDALKVDGLWLFEVQEGGVGRSVAAWAAETLLHDPDARLHLPIAGDRVASISLAGGEFVTIIHPPDADKHCAAEQGSSVLALGKQLAPFYGSAAPLRIAATWLFAISAILFLVSGSALYWRSNAIDISQFAGRYAAANSSSRTPVNDLPSIRLDSAIQNLQTDSGYLSYLKLEKGRWNHAQATSGPGAAERSEGKND